MLSALRKIFIKLISILNYIGLKKKVFYQIYEQSNKYENIKNIIKIFKLGKINANFFSHYSQIGQDIFVACCLKFKKKGFFIEIGSADGIYHSNTYFLEKNYNWNGILIEPSTAWKHNKKIRKNSILVRKAIYYKSDLDIGFDNNYKKPFNSKLSLNAKDKVKTINIKDLFNTYRVPKFIDYISIDVEGYEFEILKQIDFKKYHIKILTIEHNNNYSKINKLLLLAEYIQIDVQYTSFESWYVKKELFKNICKYN